MRDRTYCQQRNLRFCKRDAPPPQELIDDPEGFVNRFSTTARYLFEAVVECIGRHPHCYYSQESFGHMVGIGRQRTNVIFNEWEDAGIITKQRRYNDTCLYRLPEVFHRIEVCRALEGIIPAFKTLQNKILSVTQLMVLEGRKAKKATLILMPLKIDCKSSPCPTNIVEKLTPGVSGVERNQFSTTTQQKDETLSHPIHVTSENPSFTTKPELNQNQMHLKVGETNCTTVPPRDFFKELALETIAAEARVKKDKIKREIKLEEQLLNRIIYL